MVLSVSYSRARRRWTAWAYHLSLMSQRKPQRSAPIFILNSTRLLPPRKGYRPGFQPGVLPARVSSLVIGALSGSPAARRVEARLLRRHLIDYSPFFS